MTNQTPAPLTVWGRHLIDEDSFTQINQAAALSVTLRVALMPDAHVGYGIPIGGVAALEGAIAPYMVGVDIGCRMHATIFRRNPIHLQQDPRTYTNLLEQHTFFGRQAPPAKARNQHPILDDPRWQELPHELKGLQDLAAEQLGTSGGGNHFIEWVKLTVQADNPLNLPAGPYIGLVSHSGSRGVGFKIANHYSQLAEQVCHFLPKELRRLAYFQHDSELGQAYEWAMTLAGDFAQANHEVMHGRVRQALGEELLLATVQNHHNYAWRVEREGQAPVFIHRKGATPAERDVLGIIPGSMATPGFLVRGLGDLPEQVLENPSLNSAAHGSGRVLGRSQALKKIDPREVRQQLQKQGVKLLGGGLDEAPEAYKDSRVVMAAQADLVAAWAEFMPVIVRMDAPKGKGGI
jgi:tRNA-splicing ligase RtcB (3'-phosphate/5'-hydroxy nucleic acid ligase)